MNKGNSLNVFVLLRLIYKDFLFKCFDNVVILFLILQYNIFYIKNCFLIQKSYVFSLKKEK